MLMKVKHIQEEKNGDEDEKEKPVDVIDEAKQKHKQRKILKSEQIKPENIKENKRKKVPKQFYGS